MVGQSEQAFTAGFACGKVTSDMDLGSCPNA
jgi:hypothetical protein